MYTCFTVKQSVSVHDVEAGMTLAADRKEVQEQARAQTAQINVRIDRDLKEAGDAALASIGLSPSDAVRMLWEVAAKRGESLERIRKLAQDEAPDRATDSGEVDPIVANIEAIHEQYLAMGFVQGTPDNTPYKELLEDALYERHAKRKRLS